MIGTEASEREGRGKVEVGDARNLTDELNEGVVDNDEVNEVGHLNFAQGLNKFFVETVVARHLGGGPGRPMVEIGEGGWLQLMEKVSMLLIVGFWKDKQLISKTFCQRVSSCFICPEMLNNIFIVLTIIIVVNGILSLRITDNIHNFHFDDDFIC